MRCLSVDGASPCPDAWNAEFERQVKRRDALSTEERSRIDAGREERRQRRRSFWGAFPSAFHFETSAPDQLRFSPLPRTQRPPGEHDALLTALDGRLTFDPATGEITRLEYDLRRDVDEPFLRLPKGSRFEIELTRAAGEHFLPLRILTRRPAGKSGQVEERITEFAKFRKFDSESKIDFKDPIK